MADHWNPGDLARFVGNKPHCPTCLDGSIPVSRTAEYLVLDVWAPIWVQQTCGLLFAGKPAHMCSCGFVKIERDCSDDEQQQAVDVTQRQLVEAAA